MKMDRNVRKRTKTYENERKRMKKIQKQMKRKKTGEYIYENGRKRKKTDGNV